MNSRHSHVWNNRLETILNLINDGILLSDRHGSAIWANNAYADLTNPQKAHFKYKNAREPTARDTFNRALYPRVVKTGKPASMVHEFGKDKNIVLLQGYPIFDEAGDVDLVVTFAKDITVITKLREQIFEQRNTLDHYRSGMTNMLTKLNKGESISANLSMRYLQRTLARVAKTDDTVLLLGESGTGKGMLARMMHDSSSRKNKIFLRVDCADIAEDQTEAKLRGYARGAFSEPECRGWADYFKIADGGTIFFDEVGELPLSIQARLLRTLQHKEIMRVRSSRPQRVDVRIIAATSRNLAGASDNRLFRRDLYSCLSVIKFEVPPLHQRQEDIAPLIRHFLALYNQKYKKNICLSADAFSIFEAYPWPGNVRELQNTMLYLVMTGEHRLFEAWDLPESVRCYNPKRQTRGYAFWEKRSFPQKPSGLDAIIAESEVPLSQEAQNHSDFINRAADFLQINKQR